MFGIGGFEGPSRMEVGYQLGISMALKLMEFSVCCGNAASQRSLGACVQETQIYRPNEDGINNENDRVSWGSIPDYNGIKLVI